jgi:spore coat protein U-like protein
MTRGRGSSKKVASIGALRGLAGFWVAVGFWLVVSASPALAQANCSAIATSPYINSYNGLASTTSYRVDLQCSNASSAGSYAVCSASNQQSGSGGATITPWRQLSLNSYRMNWQLNNYLNTTAVTASGVSMGTIFFQTASSFPTGYFEFGISIPANQSVYNGEYKSTLVVPLELRAGTCSGALETSFTATLSVTVLVVVRCEVTSGALSFGSARTSTAQVADATATLTIVCNSPGNVPITLNLGDNAVGSQRRVKNNSNSAYTLNYDIYSDAARTQAIGNNQGPTVFANTNVPLTVTLYGRMPAQTTPSIGTYTDNLQITVNY